MIPYVHIYIYIHNIQSIFMTFINKVILVNIRLFKKRVVHTRFDVFVFLKVETDVIVSITASLKDEYNGSPINIEA
jgi:hypothetical protein